MCPAVVGCTGLYQELHLGRAHTHTHTHAMHCTSHWLMVHRQVNSKHSLIRQHTQPVTKVSGQRTYVIAELLTPEPSASICCFLSSGFQHMFGSLAALICSHSATRASARSSTDVGDKVWLTVGIPACPNDARRD